MTEQQDALGQQTATAEVLGVINASPGNSRRGVRRDVEVMRLCEATPAFFGISMAISRRPVRSTAGPTAYAEMVILVPPEPESGPARN